MEEGVPCKTPAAKLTPPVKKSQDMHDERSKLVNEYACRVLELLGMGHRLFVPRLLAVRSRFLQIKSLWICHLPSQTCFPWDSLCWMEVGELSWLFFSFGFSQSSSWALTLPYAQEGWCCDTCSHYQGSSHKTCPKAVNAFVLSSVMVPNKRALSAPRCCWKVL